MWYGFILYHPCGTVFYLITHLIRCYPITRVIWSSLITRVISCYLITRVIQHKSGHVMGRPIDCWYDGPWPGPAHQFFRAWAEARSGPSNFQSMGRGIARPITFSEDGPRPSAAHHIFKAARPGPPRPMILVGGSGRSAIFVDQPVHLTDRNTGRPMCCPVLLT